MSRETSLAWTAGILDGEGTITLVNNGDWRITPRVMLTMTDRPTVVRVYDILRLGCLGNPTPETLKHKAKHHWAAGGADAASICKILLPYLFTKKPQAELVILYQRHCMFGPGINTLSDEQKELRESIVEQMTVLNKRGK